MKKLMTKHFSKWASKQNIPKKELAIAIKHGDFIEVKK